MKIDNKKQIFIDYCKNKIKNLGNIEIEEETYQVLMHLSELRQFKNVKVIGNLDSDDAYLRVADEDDNIVIETIMVSFLDIAASMQFDSIDSSLYDYIMNYWDDIMMDEYIEQEEDNLEEDATQVSNVGTNRISVFGNDAGNKFVQDDLYKELFELRDYED